MLNEGAWVLFFFRKLFDSGIFCLKFLFSLFVVNVMFFWTVYKLIIIICLIGVKVFLSGRVNFKVWFLKFEFWLGGRICFCYVCIYSCKRGYYGNKEREFW